MSSLWSSVSVPPEVAMACAAVAFSQFCEALYESRPFHSAPITSPLEAIASIARGLKLRSA